MSIKLLDKSVYNKISAGEVVEKPASIVKELVENSIDAGAKNISISIENGGISRIEIVDDGCGIKSDEVKLAFMPHATSKLQSINDLETLSSMGFRGEALASISAVSKVELITKTSDQELGIKVLLDAGEEITRTDIATTTGTKIIVSDLFFNTPARAKFLRKPKTEENDISSYVEKLMLGNTNIGFKYIVDGKLIYNTTDCGLDEIIYTIYGNETYENLIKVDYARDNYKISGYISKPNFSKNNRTYQSLFINKRYCINQIISASVQNAYESFLMKGKFPFYVLSLTMPQNSLDVNVHPNKLEVKFENSNKIFGLFNNAIYNCLSDYVHIKQIDESLNNNNSIDTINATIENDSTNGIFNKSQIYDTPYTEIIDDNKFKNITSTNQKIKEDETSLNTNFTKEENHEESKPYSGISFSTIDNLFSKDKNKNAFYEPTILEEIVITSSNMPKSEQIDFIKSKNAENKPSFYDSELKVCGKIFNTYLIIEKENTIYLVDQHAAHERELYDKIIEQVKKDALVTQDLLVPYIFSTNREEANFINNNIELFIENGINIDQYSASSFRVYSVPVILSNIDLKNYFGEILSNLNKLVKSPIEVIKSEFMQLACKSAVKGGDDLSNNEIDTLLTNLKENKNVLLCPHGRPIVVEIDKKQIEKWFKRIV